MKIKNFVIAILIVMVFVQLISFIQVQQDVSIFENRTLALFPVLKVESFFDGSFQGQLEESLKDQFFMRDHIISTVNYINGKSREYYNYINNNIRYLQTVITENVLNKIRKTIETPTKVYEKRSAYGFF